MSSTLNGVLERLRAFGDGKLAELEARAEEHRGWLRTAVEEVAAQVASLVPASKRQRLDGSGAARATAAQADERQVRAARAQAAMPSPSVRLRFYSDPLILLHLKDNLSYCLAMLLMCRQPVRPAAARAAAAQPPTRC